MSSKSTPVILVTVALLLCAIIILAAAGVAPSSVIAQQEEETSLGDKEDLAGSIVSNVLDDHNAVNQDNTAEQDVVNLGLQDQDSVQEQDVDQDATQGDFDVSVGEAVQQSQQQPPQTELPPPPEEDTTSPVITVPEDMVVEATSEQGAVVTYAVTAQDDRDGTVPVECTPASGSTFPIGVTTVECTATDTAGNIGRLEERHLQ